ncbi:MAG: hypothetical protein ACODAJ_11910 [Planctomycetota bacterium]
MTAPESVNWRRRRGLVIAVVAVALVARRPVAAAGAAKETKEGGMAVKAVEHGFRSRLTARGARHAGVCQSTQFIVGAAGERDAEIVEAAGRLYRRWGLHRVYFSAYQRGLGDPALPGERDTTRSRQDLLTREYRLYQVDFLLRKYGFAPAEIPLEPDGNLSLDLDPKEAWARRHPERFPLDVNRASREELLRVPGLGPVTVRRILARRREARLRSLDDLDRPGKRLRKAAAYLTFGYPPSSSRKAPTRVSSCPMSSRA